MAKLVVMGVSGCGKSSLGRLLADALGAPLIEGDDHHLASSRAKMSRGIPLDDADREPWLDAIGALLAAEAGHAVLTCSALKRAYRDRLRAHVPGLRFVHIDITEVEAAERVAARTDHFFPASAVASQFEALESPVGEAGVLAVTGTAALEAQRDAALRWLAAADGRTAAPGPAALSDGTSQ